MRVALVHDDLIQRGGAEKLLTAMMEIWPKADVYTTMISRWWREHWRDEINGPPSQLRTSFMQKLPFKRRLYRHYFPLYPLAVESFRFDDYDIVISSSTRFAHGVITKPEVLHIAYINSPGRMWWEPGEYFGEVLPRPILLSPLLSGLRLWDGAAAQRPDYLIANSKTPQARIRKYWGRESAVIYPFVESVKEAPMVLDHGSKLGPSSELERGLDRTGGGSRDKVRSKVRGAVGGREENYFLVVTRLVGWKRVDLAVAACNRLRLPLVVVGEGPERQRLARLAGLTVRVVGRLGQVDMVDYYRHCQALIVTQKEDFGIASLEAQAHGRPVIAFRGGGSLETVVEGVTGEFFTAQTVDSLGEVLQKFRASGCSAKACRQQARRFGRDRFQRELKSFVEARFDEFRR